jgi:hypothetical protein
MKAWARGESTAAILGAGETGALISVATAEEADITLRMGEGRHKQIECAEIAPT